MFYKSIEVPLELPKTFRAKDKSTIWTEGKLRLSITNYLGIETAKGYKHGCLVVELYAPVKERLYRCKNIWRHNYTFKKFVVVGDYREAMKKAREFYNIPLSEIVL